MKKLLTKTVALILALCVLIPLLPFQARALMTSDTSFDATGGKVFYRINATNNTAYIIGCEPSVTAVTIPAMIGDKPVTRIENESFYEPGVDFSGLKSLSFAEGSQVNFIGNYAFYNTGIESVVLPASLEYVGDKSFANCKNLTSVAMAALKDGKQYKLSQIDRYSFGGCTKLSDITLPDSLITIGAYAFVLCTSLTSVTLPASVTSIGEMTFEGCSSLTTVTMAVLKEGEEYALNSIDYYAFGYCSALTSVTLPESLQSIGASAFSYCKSLSGITLPDSLKTLGANAFDNCTSLAAVTVPASVTSFGASAFANNSALAAVTINALTSIGDKAFSGCTGLTTLTMTNVTGIGAEAFSGCSFSSIALPESLTAIGKDAFKNCTNLASVSWPQNESFTEVKGFSGCTKLPGSSIANIPSSVTTLGEYAFAGCSFTAVVIPPSITTIGENAFYNCNSLAGSTVEIPETVTRVKAGAFALMTSSGKHLALKFYNPAVSLRSDNGDLVDICANNFSFSQHVDFYGAAEKAAGVASDVKSYFEAYNNTGFGSYIRQYTFTVLENLPTAYTVSGTVPEGATVNIKRGSTAVTVSSGEAANSFTAAVLSQADVTVTVSKTGYYDRVITRTAEDFTGNWDVGTITLELIPTTGRMYVNLTRSDTGAPLSSFDGLSFALTKESVALEKGAANGYTVQFPYIIISADAVVSSTDTLTLAVTPNDDSLKLSGGMATGTKLGGEFKLELPAWGKLAVTTGGSFAGDNNILIFNSEGKLIEAGVTVVGGYTSGALKAGTYTVTAFNASAGFSSVSSPAALTAMGFRSGTDYVTRSATVADMATTNIGTVIVPLFSAAVAGSIINQGDCAVTLDKAMIVCGTHFNVQVFYSLKEAPGSAAVRITLPAGATYMSVCSETAIIQGVTPIDNILTLNTNKQSGVFYLYGVSLPVAIMGAQSISAAITAGAVTAPLGSASFYAEAVVMKLSEAWLTQRTNSVTVYTEPGQDILLYVGKATKSVANNGVPYKTNAAGRVTIPYTLPEDAYSGQPFDLRAEAGGYKVSDRVVYSAAETEMWDFSFVHAGRSTAFITEGKQTINSFYTYVANGKEVNKYWSFFTRFISSNDMTNNKVTVQIKMMDGSMRTEPMTLIRTSAWTAGKTAYEYAAEVYIEQAGDHVFLPSLLPCGFGVDYEYDAVDFKLQPDTLYGGIWSHYIDLEQQRIDAGLTEDLSSLIFNSGYIISDEPWFRKLDTKGQNAVLAAEDAMKKALGDLTDMFWLPKELASYTNWDEVMQDVGKTAGSGKPVITYGKIGDSFPEGYVGSSPEITMNFGSGPANINTSTDALPSEQETGFTASDNKWTLTANFWDESIDNAKLSALGQSVSFAENKVGDLSKWLKAVPEGQLTAEERAAVVLATDDLAKLSTVLKLGGAGVGIYSAWNNIGGYATACSRAAEMKGYIENLEIYKNYYDRNNNLSCFVSVERELIVAKKLLAYLESQRLHSGTDAFVGAFFTATGAVTGFLTGGAGAAVTGGASMVFDVGANAINMRRAVVIEELQAELNKLRQARMSECGTFNANDQNIGIEVRLQNSTPILDPSGIVYEALESNPLKGVTATLWYSSSSDGSGAIQWTAADYDQTNPQTTAADGTYAWNVPAGWWQVRFLKEGYTNTATAWMEVPPPQMNLTTAMVSTAPPAVLSANAYTNYIELCFSQYMNTIVPLTLTDGMTGTWQNTEGSFSKILHITKSGGFAPGSTVSFTLSGAENYAGTKMVAYASGDLAISSCPAQIILNYETTVSIQAGTTPTVTVRVKDSEGNYMSGVTVDASSSNTLLAAIDSNAVTDSDGKAVFNASALLPGLTDVTFTVHGTSLSKTVSLRVTVDANRPDRPTAQLGSTNLTAGSPKDNYVTVSPGATLKLYAETGATIYYTTDDTCPCQNTVSRKAYTGPIPLTANTKYRIAAYKDGMAYSERLNLTVTLAGSGANTPVLPSEMDFIDVSANDWYSDAIRFVFGKGFMLGTSARNFSPNTPMTRAMLVMVLYRLEEKPSGYVATFKDVMKGEWYTDAVAWAAAKGIVSGYDSGVFGPDDLLTREQMVTILYRYAQFKNQNVKATAGLDAFLDASTMSGWAFTGVSWAVTKGIVSGVGSNLLNPMGSASRAELAQILMRFLQLYSII